MMLLLLLIYVPGCSNMVVVWCNSFGVRTSVVHCTYMLLSCHRYCIVIASADSHAHLIKTKVNEPVS